MGFENFKKSLFSQVFTSYDFFVESWVENVFKKIKVLSVLPSYIKRNKEVNQSNVLCNNTLFTYNDNDSYALKRNLELSSGDSLTLEQEIDWGKRFELSFEVEIFNYDLVSATIFSIGNFLDIKKETVPERYAIFIYGTQRGFFTIDTNFRKIRIIRNHSTWSIYINDTLNTSFEYDTDKTIFSGKLLDVTETNDTTIHISNIKVLDSDRKKILNWWKLDIDNQGLFLDVGLNDYDFYSFFSTIIRMFAYIVRYSKYFKLIDLERDFLERFLTSRGISYRHDATNEELLSVYNDWKAFLRERGTWRPSLEKNTVNNYSFNGLTDGLEANLTSTINIKTEYEISFDIDVLTDGNPYSILQKFTISKNVGGLQFAFSDIDGVKQLSFTKSNISIEDGVRSVKFVKGSNHISLYIDNINIPITAYTLTLNHPEFKFSKLFENFTEENYISNLSIKFFDSGVEKGIYYPINDVDVPFLKDISCNPDYEAYIHGFNNSYTRVFSKLFISDKFSKMNNYEKKDIDGELLMIYDKSINSELVLVKTNTFDTSWTIGSCSPLQKQTYPIKGFNKLPNKEKEVSVLSHYPVRGVNGDVDIDLNDVYVNNGRIIVQNFTDLVYYDIIKNYTSSNGNYLKKWTVPCMTENSYEVSFRLRVQGLNPDFLMKFYSESNNNSLRSAKTGIDSTTLLNNYNFISEGFYWIRGIIYAKGDDLTDKQKGLSFDMENTNHLQFKTNVNDTNLSMGISVKANPGNDAAISLYDFQFRLLNLPFTKVAINSKKMLFLYGRNNSFNSTTEIEQKVLPLIPYNVLLKIL
jgi:hypothetical protein